MQSLDEKAWDAIELDSMFTFERGKEKNMASLIQGHIPLVSARKVNNGIKGFVDNPAKVIKGGNVISLNNDGDGGAGLAYYQPVDFALDTHVTALHPQKVISSDALLCMTASISKQYAVFGHGRSISLPRAHRIQNMLPVTDSGEPDYAYMAEYAQQKRNAMLAKYRAYVEARIAELGKAVEIPALDEKEWHAFHLEEIGTVTSGRDIYAAERVKGNTPYITSGGTNNGVGYFVGNINDTLDSGYIALNRNGAVGKAFYHPSKSLMGNDCRKVHLKDADRNLFVGQFVALCLSMQSGCFSYSRKLGTARAKRMQVMLPVTDSDEPDYKYMEQYSKNMMLRKYQQYLTFLQQRSDA